MMKKYITIVLISALFCTNTLLAQHAHFTTTGIIEFEKNINTYAIIKKQINKDNDGFLAPMFDEYKKNNPQFKKLKSTLSFSGNNTLFTPIEPENEKSGFFGDGPITTQKNIVYNDFNTHTKVCQKEVFEETFLLKDTLRKIKWKITDETRVIAGYTCRRANAIVLDSIYVVAFYTTEIPLSGGPESFTGLPGMILGVALPHENITWFATKVTDTTLPTNTIVPPKKGKPVDDKGLKEALQKAFKSWGEWAQPYYKGFLL